MALLDGVLAAERANAETLITHSKEHAAIKAAIERLSAEVAHLQEPRTEPIYMSVDQAAARYGICRVNIYEILKMPECPATLKVGQRRLLPIGKFDAFMEEQFLPEERSSQ